MKNFKRKLKEDAINTFLLTGLLGSAVLGAGSEILRKKLQQRADRKAAERHLKRQAKKNVKRNSGKKVSSAS